MDYRAVGKRCAVHLRALHLPVSDEEALTVLRAKGFTVLEVDIVALARGCIGKTRYQSGARPSQAPAVVDCSSFIKWLFGERGVWLPRRPVQQLEYGEKLLKAELVEGDVVFASGWINHYRTDPAEGVGHVGLVTGEGTVIHAEDSKANVIESSLADFWSETVTPRARRYLPKSEPVYTLQIPDGREDETADDVRWLTLRSLPKV